MKYDKVRVLIEQSLCDDYETKIIGVYKNESDAKSAFIQTLNDYNREPTDIDYLNYDDGEYKLVAELCDVE